MGSRPPRQQPLPKSRRQPRLMTHEPAPETTGFTMETLTPIIGLAAFPVALVAAFVGYIASGSTRSIGAALVVTLIVSIGVWLLLRAQSEWRRTARMTNELVLALLVAIIGISLVIGGIAGLSVGWAAIGLAILVGAWFIQRMGPSSGR